MGVFDDFYAAAQTKITALTDRYNSIPNDTSNTIGSSIFNALYSYGAGRLDKAREQIVAGALATPQGKAIQAEATQQTLAKYGPMIALGAIAFLGLVFLTRKY